ncbi:hypothetical protein [Mycobacteroides abscessus]|uniref:hypothetical protein n=1 Tax=Mycobacteroides abscessus TaxID=36809 RepID=UPI0039C87CCF
MVGCYRGLTGQGRTQGRRRRGQRDRRLRLHLLFVINVVMTAIGGRVLVKH